METRALAAPAFFRLFGNYDPYAYNYPDDCGPDYARARIAFALNLQEGDTPSGYGEFHASAGGTSIAMGFNPGDTSTLYGTSSSTATDISPVLPPFSPVGAFSVALTSQAHLAVSHTGTGAVFNYLQVDTQTGRTYYLGDTSSLPEATNLVEEAVIDYLPNLALTTMSASAGIFDDGSFGLGIHATGDALGITSVHITGYPGSFSIPAQGTIVTFGGTTVTFTAGARAIIATATTPLSALTPTTTSSFPGLRYETLSATSLQRYGFITEIGVSDVTSEYSAHFES